MDGFGVCVRVALNSADSVTAVCLCLTSRTCAALVLVTPKGNCGSNKKKVYRFVIHAYLAAEDDALCAERRRWLR